MIEYKTIYENYRSELIDLFNMDLECDVNDIVDMLLNVFYSRKSVYIIGNGGSAASSMHLVCDLGKLRDSVGNRFRVMSLNTNMPFMTAIANDDEYKYVFRNQLESLFQKDDMLIAISVSGNSKNILEAIEEAKKRDGNVIGLLGFEGGKAIDKVDKAVLIPNSNYGVVEDIHIILCHIIVQTINKIFKQESSE